MGLMLMVLGFEFVWKLLECLFLWDELCCWFVGFDCELFEIVNFENNFFLQIVRKAIGFCLDVNMFLVHGLDCLSMNIKLNCDGLCDVSVLSMWKLYWLMGIDND